MDFIMAYRSAFSIEIMVEAAVIFRIVGKPQDQVFKAEMGHQILVLSAEGFQLVKNLFHTFF